MSDAPAPKPEKGGRPASGARPRLASAAWLLSAVPLVAVVELGLHVKQTGGGIVPESDWIAARDAVKAELRPDDLVVFAPGWTDPLGRRYFGDAIATREREGRSDEARFARAFEVSIRGAHDESFSRWRAVGKKDVGAITITTYENPAYTQVVDDLVHLVTPERLAVSRVDGAGEAPCAFQRGASAGGSTVVPQGLLTPADKFVCGGGHVGVAVLHDLEHRPRLCIFATPTQGSTLRLRFKDVAFAESLHGHAGVQWVAERVPGPERIPLSFSAFDRPLGNVEHKVGVGWVGFELPTGEIAGKRGDLVVDVGPASQRQFCFEATTRRPPSSAGQAGRTE